MDELLESLQNREIDRSACTNVQKFQTLVKLEIRWSQSGELFPAKSTLEIDRPVGQVPMDVICAVITYDQAPHLGLVRVQLEQAADRSTRGQISNAEILEDMPHAQVGQLVERI